MVKRTIISAAFFFLLCVPVNLAFACTTFCLKGNGEVLFGKNYDWMIGDGLVFVNRRGVVKTSAEESNPAKWVSQYGSVTFNQYGRENPSGGMNEAGLVIELMWLDETQYPKVDSRPAVDVLEWIQYQLDSSATVAEVITNSEKIRISSQVKLHYLVNDRAGNTTTIEFLDGNLVAHRGATLPVSTLTNDTYSKSLSYAKTTSLEKARGNGSLERFARAANKTGEFDKQGRSEADAVNYAFEILSNVAQPGATQWSIVYDQKRGKIYFRTLQSPQIRSIDAKSFDYSCGSQVKIVDMNLKAGGDISARFADYTRAANRDLIEHSFNGTEFLKNIPAPLRDSLASYPEQFVCSAAQSRKKATRTITNRELAPYELARIRSDAAWEKRQKELGLPSLEEIRRELARRELALDEFLARKRLEEEMNRREREAELRAEIAARVNATNYQGGQYYWPTDFLPVNGVFPYHSRFRQGSPCGFNPSPSCLLTHPFSLFNQGAFPARRTIIVAPRPTPIVGGPRGGVVIPGRRH
jgi:penicillin V acylase-like amidase (Ntn superfamily)